ncbi:HNH endonuclease family protein [Cellulomonas alba]|uniref:HNH endonuclease family protein n=1 Tax=Cellulomonas alba TaxID=3053467 RepID=A0ABT7SG28_9CELL|nr:HNH endonuclease family protein [Cellulomonas alba]MDM7855141.1 HNH endonuclease family protein [Cellulomonas alba]
MAAVGCARVARHLPVAAVVVLAVALVVGLGGPAWQRERASSRYPVSAVDLAAGRSALAALPVRALASDDGYSREQFGAAWTDVDRNGCDTRDDVLRRDLADVELDPATHGCVVLRGRLDDPYTGRVIAFARGPTSATVQIDHVVALDDAWRTGAQAWSAQTRLAYANDPAVLLAVDGEANQRKGAGDASQWLPPDGGYRCVYVLRQVRIKAAYGLWVTPAEHDAMARALRSCVVAG